MRCLMLPSRSSRSRWRASSGPRRRKSIVPTTTSIYAPAGLAWFLGLRLYAPNGGECIARATEYLLANWDRNAGLDRFWCQRRRGGGVARRWDRPGRGGLRPGRAARLQAFEDGVGRGGQRRVQVAHPGADGAAGVAA